MPLQTVESSDDKALQEIANNLFRSHKVVVITGAGISTSAGIPDFRSRDGLYNLIPEQAFKSLPTPPSSNPSTPFLKRTFDVFSDEQNPDTPSPKHLKLGNNDTSTPPSSQSSTTSTSNKRSSLGSRLKGEDLFSSRVWNSSQSAAVFYRFIASLRQQVYSENTKATATHKFIRALRDGGRLMRCYTQNIDGLESRVGLCTDLSRGKGNKRRFMKKYYEAPLDILDQNHDGGCEVVSLHGDLDKLRCTLCHDLFEWSQEHTEIFLEAAAPKCNTCTQKSQEREATGKRGLCIGALRPNIVLYGEENPANTSITPLAPFDIATGPEVLVIMGTSLKVFGLQKMVRDFARAVHASKANGRVIFVNRTRPAESVWDGIIDDYVAMDCDDFVESIHEKRSDLWLRQGDIRLKVEKVTTTRKRKVADEEEGAPPTKRTKIVIEIPLIEPDTERPRKRIRKAKKPVSITQEQLSSLITATKSTPAPGATYQALKTVNTMHPQYSLLSPLKQVRPQSSPLTNTTFNRLTIEQLLTTPRTPGRPPMSPLTPNLTMNPNLPVNTPTRKMSRIFDEVTGRSEREQRQKHNAANDENENEEKVPLWKLSNQSLGRRLIACLGSMGR